MSLDRPSGAVRPRAAAYVVLSHSCPDQVSRLCAAIHRSTPQAWVVVHHDARGSQPPEPLGPWMRVHTHRRRADWGTWELAAESLRALHLAQIRTGAHLLTLVSGQDYPTGRLDTWEETFFEHGGGWQGEARPLSYRPRWGRPHGVGDDDLTRYTYLWWAVPGAATLSRGTGPFTVAARRALFLVGHYAEPVIDVRNLARGRGMHVGLRNPCPPFGAELRCVKGSQWLALDADALNAVLRIYHENGRLRRSYRRSVIPDESYLQSMLAAVRPPQRSAPVSFVDWSVELDRPRTLTIDDLQQVVRSGSPFCRKVEPGVSDPLMDALDQRSIAPSARS